MPPTVTHPRAWGVRSACEKFRHACTGNLQAKIKFILLDAADAVDHIERPGR